MNKEPKDLRPCVRCGKTLDIRREAWGEWTMHKKCWHAKLAYEAFVEYTRQTMEKDNASVEGILK